MTDTRERIKSQLLAHKLVGELLREQLADLDLPVLSWKILDSGKVLAQPFGETNLARRTALTAWADKLDLAVRGTQMSDFTTRLTAVGMYAGVPVTVQTSVYEDGEGE